MITRKRFVTIASRIAGEYRYRLIADSITASRMCVYDFDDTLVSSFSSVTVRHGSGKKSVLDSAAFAYYKPAGGDRIDFSDFNHVNKPRIIKKNMDRLKADAGDKDARVVILTARPKGSASVVKKFMEHLGLKSVDVVALQSSNPMDKAKWIEKEAGDHVKEVTFTDDSARNVEAVGTLKGKIKGKVVTDNPPHPKEEDYEGELIDKVFQSDKPTSAEVEIKDEPKKEDVKKKVPEKKLPVKKDDKGNVQESKEWWNNQTSDFKRDYCRNHPSSKHCSV